MCRVFADALEAVRGPKARVVAVTSLEKAEATNRESQGFFDRIEKVL
jgi:hypothetical protein